MLLHKIYFGKPIFPAFKRLRQEDHSFEATQGYIVGSMPAIE